jgi:hypothetical protein
MRWRSAAVALVLTGACGIAPCAQAASAIGVQGGTSLAVGNPHVQPVYWGWRRGVRIWIGAPYPTAHYGPPGYYGRAPYWYGGRGYWHRGWSHGGWHYW